LATGPPASLPAEQGPQAVDGATAPPPESEDSIEIVDLGVEAPGVEVDLTEPARPLVIDLVSPAVAPPGAPVEPGPSRVEPLGQVGLLAARSWQLVVKRTIDIVGSLSILVALSPLMVATALAIRITSKGPVIFAQRRIGKNGRPFTMLKFRSMIRDAHEVRQLHAHRNHYTSGPVFKIPRDPRITRVGRVIRRMSLDELPQLLNVLHGEMSLVGPRPALPEEFEACDEHVRQRTLVAPGLTCIWQVSGRSDVDFLRWVDMDIEYIRTWSLRLDLRLLVKTIPAVLFGRGAY
jgi:lipopolysaccharide/colanic/teichoic acid biosynthesis glycosyltransferase